MDDNWKESLPEELQAAPYFKNAENIEQVLADLTGAAQWQGNSIRIPKDDEDRTAFAEKVAKYLPESEHPKNSATAESLPEPFEVGDIELPDNIIEQARELGLNQDQFNAIAERHANDTQSQQEQLATFRQEQADNLHAEWGTESQRQTEQVAQFLANSKAPDTIIQALEQGTLDSGTTLWLAELSALGEESAEISSINSRNDANMNKMAGLDAKLRSGTLNGQEYQRVLAQKVELMKRAFGDPSRRSA